MVIALLVITMTTWLIYWFANRVLSCNLRLKPLALCAACAFFISLVLPRIIVSYTSLMGTLGVLAIFATIAAYFIAYYEDGRVKTETGAIVSSSQAVEGKCPTDDKKPEQQADLSPECTQQTAFSNDSGQLPLVSAAKFDLEPEPELNPTAESEAEFVFDSEAESELDVTGEIWCAALDSSLEQAPVVSPSSDQPPDLANSSLDELLDFAFMLKEQHNDNAALKVFRQALELYPDSEAAPYLAIEIGGLLKQKGAYDDAIKVFSDARKLPALTDDSTIAQEFIETIAYLRIVKNVLLSNKVGLIPFNRISDNLNKKIEAEFREWRNLA